MNKTIAGLSASKHLDSLFVSLIGFILILIYTRHSGVGISPDSIVYVSVARNLNAHGMLIDYNLKPTVDFPLFYPLFLGVTSFISRIDPVAAGPYLNALLFAIIIFCTGKLIDSFTGTSRYYKLVILLSIAISPSLFDVYAMLWSETLFILLIILFMLAFTSYLKTRSVAGLIGCAIIAGLACVTRYAGITVIATGLMMMVFDRSLNWKKKIFHGALFSLVAIALLAANLFRNAMYSDSLTGPRESGITSLGDNIFYYGKVLCSWLPFADQYPAVYSAIAIILFVIIVVVYLKRSWFAVNYGTAENCFAAFFIVYTVFIIGVSTLSHFEQINNRFISPLFIPMLITITCWVPGVLTRLPVRQRSIAFAAAGLVILGFQVNELRKLYDMYQEARDYGIAGYTDDSWKKSQTAEFLRQHPEIFKPGYGLYSNAAEAAYFNGGLNAVSLPHYNIPDDISDFYKKKGMYLIWFRAIEDPDLITLSALRKRASVVKQYSFKDGDIYFVKPGINP
ncbi:hypothetical protein TH53_14935 [Pedobacter lusitanus]|uniref:Glycosyltransferase RgtA/B/C/D-like domain-containing protein n=1 Tax=Pedobacter lusitanus TaxID=1503925 RepID=A0A0D0F4C3_9SPHI|nr:glycosyltransferase family 39 protein [Pedobacter lusitanus]KIO76433.1 hypothetical protein TH53_14935 [Pedobacter lusitanus]